MKREEKEPSNTAGGRRRVAHGVPELEDPLLSLRWMRCSTASSSRAVKASTHGIPFVLGTGAGTSFVLAGCTSGIASGFWILGRGQRERRGHRRAGDAERGHVGRLRGCGGKFREVVGLRVRC